jgi:murein tripeptide amidase MpaA
MVALKVLLVMLVAESVSAESRQWPFSLWRKNATKQADSLVELSKTQTFMPSFYHTSQQLSQTLANMKCAGMSYMKVEDPAKSLFQAGLGETALEVVSMKPVNADEEIKHKVMLISGEHAREMISAETGLGFVQELCKDTSLKARKNTEYLIVVNANPRSRMMVENGQTCLRTNPNGVDLNRNWDDLWASDDEASNPDTNPGSKAFSEPESRILKKLMEDFKPNTFLDVHSGTLGLYLPNGLLKKEKYTKDVESLITKVNDKNCQCPMGIANVEVGYQTSGSSLDYAFDKVGTNFAVAMEVWAAPSELTSLRKRWNGQKEMLKHKKSSFLEIEPTTMSMYNFIKAEQEVEQKLHGMSTQDCFAFFNPTDEASFKKTVSKWSTTLLELSMAGRKVPDAASSMMQEEPKQEGLPMGHIARVGGIVLLMVGLWFLWQRFSHLFAKNKDVEAAPLTRPMGPIQVSD